MRVNVVLDKTRTLCKFGHERSVDAVHRDVGVIAAHSEDSGVKLLMSLNVLSSGVRRLRRGVVVPLIVGVIDTSVLQVSVCPTRPALGRFDRGVD